MQIVIDFAPGHCLKMTSNVPEFGDFAMLIRQIVAACLVYPAMSTVAHAQSANFTCPKAGTVTQLMVSTITYNGPSPSDPLVCMQTNRNGQAEKRLYNLFTLSNLNDSASTLAPMKAGMSDLLSGRKTSVTFPDTANNGFVLTETWTFVRKEPMTVGDKTFNTLVFDREITADPRAPSAFHGHYMTWVDPAAGLWLRAELSGASGAINKYPQSYRVHTVTP